MRGCLPKKIKPVGTKPIILKLEPLSPSYLAKLEIDRLRSDRSLQGNYILGGPTTSKMKKENERKRQEFESRKLAIIKKHGVVDEYLDPLLELAASLRYQLSLAEREINELQKLKQA